MSEDHLRSIQMVRRAREEVFGGGLFSDPAWDILLELYAAHLGQRTVSINDLAAEIRLPPGNVSRWVAVLSEKEIVETIGMDGDPVRLTSYGAAGMGRLAGHWGSAFLSI
jgi:DNA-binding MarR family transcriptional regulator